MADERRSCSTVTSAGRCRATPMREADHCFWHSPEHQDEVAEARRLGGQRRKRERIVSGVYDLEGLDTIPKIRRILEVAVLDTLGLENSINRSRALASLATAAARLLEAGELEERVEALEAVTRLGRARR